MGDQEAQAREDAERKEVQREEPERDEPEREEEGSERRPGVVTDVLTTAEGEAEKLQEGRKLPFFAGPLPMRAVVAMGIFVVVFLAIWLVLWALFGGLGIALGWIIAAVVGFLAVKLAADRMA